MFKSLQRSVLILFILFSNGFPFQPFFDSRIIYPLENPKNKSITADFNNDGYLDYIASTYSSSGAAENYSYVFLNNGDGTFHFFDSFQTGGNNITRLLSGDFNNDGFNDFATVFRTYSSNILTIYLNKGNGSFQNVNQYEIGNSTYAAPHMAILDMNNDGFDDILQMKAENKENIEVLISNGDGSFAIGASGEEIIEIPMEHYGKINQWDINHDAYEDIFIQGNKTITPVTGDPYTQSFIATYINQGDTTFVLASEYLYGTSSDEIYSYQTGYFNSDSEQDILLKDTENIFTILINNSDGSFSNQGTCPLTSTPYYYHYSAGDINGDGYDDISVSDREKGIVSVYMNNGNDAITFSEAVDYPGNYYEGNYAKEEFSCHDLNNDGYSDFAFYAVSLSVTLNHGDGTFENYQVIENMGTQSKDIAVEDFNGDGFSDIITVDDLYFYASYNDGNGNFLPSKKMSGGVSKITGILSGNFNDDEIPDFALTGCSVKLFYGSESGVFESGPQIDTGLSCLECSGGQAADFNGDGQVDFALYYFGYLKVLLSKSDKSYELETYPFSSDIVQTKQIKDLVLVDIDADNDTDILFSYGTNIFINFNDGGGHFSIKDSISSDLGFTGLTVEDLNNDGLLDIASNQINGFEGKVAIYLNNGSARFTLAGNYGLFYLPNYDKIYSADMDNDGDPDLLSNGKNGISLFLNEGDGSFPQCQVYSDGDESVTFQPADFDQDSTIDIAVLSSIPGKELVYIFPNSKRLPVSIAGNQTDPIKPNRITLEQNYPNPFNAETVISYQLTVNCEIELSIFNVLGQKVTTLVNRRQETGSYRVTWDASDFPSGLYFYKLETNKRFIQTKKLILLK